MNNALTTTYGYEQHKKLLAKAKYKLLQISLVKRGYPADKYSVLNPECQTNLVVTECRKTEWVEYYTDALAMNADLNTLPDMQSCELASSDSSALKP